MLSIKCITCFYQLLLGTGVPYYISVGAVNELGEGNIATATVFTKSLS